MNNLSGLACSPALLPCPGSVGLCADDLLFLCLWQPVSERSRWLHNKPWLCKLASSCNCGFKGRHLEVRGSFTAERIGEFNHRCRPDAQCVYGFEPRVGQSVASYSGAYPLGLTNRTASGSVAASRGEVPRLAVEHRLNTARFLALDEAAFAPMAAPDSEPYPARPWHEDPEWISELCQSLKFRELFRYTFAKPGHINVNEARVCKSWIKSVARGSCRTRVMALLDSRVTIGAAAKGRSSSFAISRSLQGCLGYVLGSGIYQSLLHCYSQDNVADNPGRGKPVGAPTRLQSRWLQELMQGQPERFEKFVLSARIAKNPARWLRFLLLLAGDIERNPGPPARPVWGPLDMAAGFAPSTAHKMAKSFEFFKAWLHEQARCRPNMCLRRLLPRPLRCGGTGSTCTSRDSRGTTLSTPSRRCRTSTQSTGHF